MKLSDLDPDARLTLVQAAQALRVSKQRVYQWIQTGRLAYASARPKTVRAGDVQDFATLRAIDTAVEVAARAYRRRPQRGYEETAIPFIHRLPT